MFSSIILTSVKKLIRIMIIIIIVIIINLLIFSIEYFLCIFGNRPNVFKILEEVWYAKYAGSTEIGNTFC